MADEQTPQADFINDAIRQAEQQLEATLESLRMSALGDPGAANGDDDDAAVLRPTSGAGDRTSHEQALGEPAGGVEAGTRWREDEGDDLRFAPADGPSPLGGSGLYVPDEDDASYDELPREVQDHSPPAAQADPGSRSSWTEVSDLTPVWTDDESQYPQPVTHASDPPPVSEHPVTRASTFEPTASAAPGSSTVWGQFDPGDAEHDDRHMVGAMHELPYAPSEEELQFWAQTRTALRSLHQVTQAIPAQVAGDVSTEVRRIVGEELAPTDHALRLVQQQLQQQLPRLQDRLESVIEQSLVAPNNGIRQLQEELPVLLEGTARELRGAIRHELDQTATTVHGAVQNDIAQLEQSVATNVTRMAHATTEAVVRVERDVDSLGESVDRLERGVHGEFERVEAQLRTAIDRVEQTVREELVEPSETVRKLDEELPARFTRVERTLLEQLQSSHRELSNVFTSLVESNRAALDRLASVASTLDDDRVRRTEDVELIVDTVTTGWEGLAGAMKALFRQNEETSRRVAGIEQRLAQLRDLEGSVEKTMSELRSHVSVLQPAPIVVTVSHPDAEVQNTTRAGWVPERSS